MRRTYMKFYISNRLRIRSLVIIFVATINLIFGISIILFVLSIYENDLRKKDSSLIQLNTRNISGNNSIKNQYDAYFQIDYNIVQALCRPLQLFNTTETISSIQNMTNQKFNEILSRNITINLQILRINTKIIKPERLKQTVLIKSRKVSCDYVIELFVGIDFCLNCNDTCRSSELRRMTLVRNPFKDLSLKFSVFNPNALRSSIEYDIENVSLYRSIKYFEKSVFIQSLSEIRYVSTIIVDSNGYKTSVLMSNQRKSLFIVKNGLDEYQSKEDSSSIYVSFLSLSLPNSYLRHEDGRIKLSKNDQSSLFKKDATFKLIYDYQKDRIVLQSINLAESFIAVDHITNTALILIKSQPQSIIDKFPNNFLFKLIIFT